MPKVKAGFSLTESVVNILLVSTLFLVAIPVITTKVKSLRDRSDQDGQIWFETYPVKKGIYYNDGTIGINVDNDFIDETYSGYFQNQGIIIGSYNSEEDNSVFAYGNYDPTLSSKTLQFDYNNNFIWDPEICTLGTIGGGSHSLKPFSFNEGSPAGSFAVGGSGNYSFRGSGSHSCEGSGDYAYEASGSHAVSIEGCDATGSHSASIGNENSSVSGTDAVLIGGDRNNVSGGIVIGGHDLKSTGAGIVAGGESPYDWKENTALEDTIDNLIDEIDDANSNIAFGIKTIRGNTYENYYNVGKTLLGGYSNYAPTGNVIGGTLNTASSDGLIIGGKLNNAGSFSKFILKGFGAKAIIAGGQNNYASGGRVIGGIRNTLLGSDTANNLIIGNYNELGDPDLSVPTEYFNTLIIGRKNKIKGNNVLCIGSENDISTSSTASNDFKTIAFGNKISASTTQDSFLMRFGSGTTTNVTISGYSGIKYSTVSSDKRLKKDIHKINYGLNTILKLNPVVFKYSYNEKKVEDGFIAQEIDKIFPDVVDKTTKYLTLNYTRLYQKITIALINAYKEIFGKIILLQKENIKLNQKIIKLKQKLDKLEGKRYE